MNKEEALDAIQEVAGEFAGKSHAELASLIDKPQVCRKIARGKTIYQIVIRADWDDVPNRVLRLTFMVDDAGWRALAPLARGVLIGPGEMFEPDDVRQAN